jgi:uncharacterized DUF497 family protein
MHSHFDPDYLMTYTERDDEPHIISLRKAEKHEIRFYAKEITR